MSKLTQSTVELDNSFADTAGNILKYFDEKEKEEILKELRNIVIENCRTIGEIKAANEVKDELMCTDEESSEDRNVEKILETYKESMAKINVNPLDDPRLLTYDRQVEDLQLATQSTSSGTMDDLNTDLRLTGTDINVIDPITKTRMTNPVKNMVCGHVYDKESVSALLKKNKNTRCPVVGCGSTNYITLSQCRTDIVTKMYLENNPA